MSALADLQRALQDYVLDRPQRGASSPQAPAVRAVIATPDANERERLHIYAYAYRARLCDVLGNDFPGLRALAGDEEFQRIGFAYIDANPSPHFNVRWYGQRLETFLRDTPPWRENPALAEMAELEWKMGLAFDADDEPVVGADDVARVAPHEWPRMRLRLHPSLQRMRLHLNVGAIRRAMQREEMLPATQALESAQSWVAWRKNSIAHYRRLGGDESAALDALAAGATFAQLCETLCDWHAVEEVPGRAAGIFRLCIDDAWVCALELSEE